MKEHDGCNYLQYEVGQLEDVFAKELTADLARRYMASFVSAIGGIQQEPEMFIERGNALHYIIGKDIYGPLIVGYCQWLKQETQKMGYEGNVLFALRDALPLMTAAEVLWTGDALVPQAIHANRPLLGIEDEIAPDISLQNGKVRAYLTRAGCTDNGTVVWADTGAWGTVIRELKNGYIPHARLYPFFWYSHNPHIPGFINTVLEEAGMDSAFGELLNDSMECVFPQLHKRPVAILPDSSGVILVPNTYLSVQWGLAALSGVRDRAIAVRSGDMLPSRTDQIYMLHQLSARAKTTGEWTGVLPVNTPTWSLGQKFLSEWPDDLLP